MEINRNLEENLGENEGSATLEDGHSVEKSTKQVYNSRKPKWWKNLGGKPTKSQKRAMNHIFETHRCPAVAYGTFLDMSAIFPSGNDIWLEIGFGRGENLLALAHRKKNERVCLIGAEIHKPGVGVACQRMQSGIENKKYYTDYVTYSPDRDPYHPTKEEPSNPSTPIESVAENPYENVRIHPGDGVKLLPYIPASSLAAVLVTFPDPFPKADQSEWRLVQPHTLLEIHRILREGGLFYLATDHDGYNEWCQTVMDGVNMEQQMFQRVEPCPDRLDWLPAISTYEQKGWNEGRKTRLNCWRKI